MKFPFVPLLYDLTPGFCHAFWPEASGSYVSSVWWRGKIATVSFFEAASSYASASLPNWATAFKCARRRRIDGAG